MSILLRKTVFYVLLLVYLIVCPLVILYVLGYIFKPGIEPGLVTTGLIHLSTLPSGASVYLGNSRYTERTPTVIRDLLPGGYPVRVVLKDHEPWSRTVFVQPKKATALAPLLLWPKQPNRTQLLPGAFQSLIPLSGSRFLILMNGRQPEGGIVYDSGSGESWPLVNSNSPFRGGRIQWHASVEGSPFLLMRLRLPKQERFLGLELKHRHTQSVDLTRLFPDRPIQVQWSSHIPNPLFALSADGFLDQIDIDTMAIHPRIMGPVLGYGLYHTTLYALMEDGSVRKRDHGNENDEILIRHPYLSKMFTESKGLWRLTVLAENRVLFHGPQGQLLANVPPYGLAKRDVLGFEWDRHRQRLLVWQSNAIGILDISKLWKFPEERALSQRNPTDTSAAVAYQAQGSRSFSTQIDSRIADSKRNEGSNSVPLSTESLTRWVFHQGRQIQQAFWALQGNYILFLDEDAVFLLEAASWTDGQPRRLLMVRPGSSIGYMEGTGMLYYLDAVTARLSAIEIVPRKSLSLLPSLLDNVSE